MAAAGGRLLRVLCLHGSSQTKEILRARLGWLPKKARGMADLVFVDAPHELPLREGDSVPTRTWWRHQAGDAEKEASLRESFAALEKVWREQGPFDGVIGFSMGAAAAARMAALPSTFPGIQFVILGGAPSMTSMPAFWRDAELDRISVPSLHIMGKTDRVVDVASSLELSERFVGAQTYVHEQGHLIPSNAPARNLIVSFLEEQYDRILAHESVTPPSPPPQQEQRQEAQQTAAPASKEEDPKSGAAPKQAAPSLCASEDSAGEQRDEMEALESIYPDTMVVLQPAPQAPQDPCGSLKFRLACEGSPLHEKLALVVTYPPSYPDESPRVQIEHSLGMLQFPQRVESALLRHIRAELEAQAGMPCVYTAISAAETWLEDPDNIASLAQARSDSNAAAAGATVADDDDNEDDDDDDVLPGTRKIWDEDPGEEAENKLVENATKDACLEVARRQKEPVEDAGHVAKGRGVKKFVVGLVGKPSAGKSTLFCCTTRLQTLAKVAAHPFTTIEPNYGVGWWASNDESDRTTAPEDEAFASEHGRDGQGRRLLPLLIKDVAGLIPGAYKGQGKGNKFLNDLCDADVLIHVVDVSGTSDRNGVAVMDDIQSASSAEDDIKWVREELHRWIFGNVIAKWRGVVRAARARNSEHAAEDRLVALLTGYQGPTRSIVTAAAARSKLDPIGAENWTRADLHRFIAHFLSVRFPMCLALNKCDKLVLNPKVGQAAGLEKLAHAKKVALEQGYVAVPCTAMLETSLLSMSAEGKITYEFGSRSFDSPAGSPGADAVADSDPEAAALQMKLRAARKVIEIFGSTGVVDCISSAVALREPTLVYPSTDLKSAKRRECLQALPGSTVEDIFSALKHDAVEAFRLEGDFIRAEGTTRAPGGGVRLVGKDAVLDASIQVLRILTNRKVAWQHSLKPKAPKGAAAK